MNLWTPTVGDSFIGRVYRADPGTTQLAYVRKDDGTEILVDAADWPEIAEGTLVRVTYGERQTKMGRALKVYAVERLDRLKPASYNPPWSIDAALFEEGKREGRGAAKTMMAKSSRAYAESLCGLPEASYKIADASPHAPWGGAHGRATLREDWAAGFREGYADGAGKVEQERCKACATRKRHGFEGQCPTCASERTRAELKQERATTTRCPICRKPAHAGETDESGAHPACRVPNFYDAKPVPVPKLRLTTRGLAQTLIDGPPPPCPRFSLDSTVREVLEALTPVWPVEVRQIEATEATRRFETSEARGVHVGWEASCLFKGTDAHGRSVPTRRLSALAPTHLEAFVVLANVVVGER